MLEADGISREMIEAQRARVDLISRLAEAFEQGDEALTALVEQSRDQLDYEFFATLTAFAEASAQASRDESASILLALRDRLLEITGFELDEEATSDEELNIDDVIDRLIAASDDEIEPVIGEVRPVIDYSFFEEWTNRIDAAEQAGDQALVEQLTARRTLVRETVERMDRQAQEMFENGAVILNAVIDAPNLGVALREQADKVDEGFLLVLEAHIGAAQRAGRPDMVERLSEIQQLAAEILQEKLSPEDRFINELLQAETPQAATKLLRQNPVIITTTFVKRLNELADESEKNGRKPLADRLRQLAREAGAMLF